MAFVPFLAEQQLDLSDERLAAIVDSKIDALLGDPNAPVVDPTPMVLDNFGETLLGRRADDNSDNQPQ